MMEHDETGDKTKSIEETDVKDHVVGVTNLVEGLTVYIRTGHGPMSRTLPRDFEPRGRNRK